MDFSAITDVVDLSPVATGIVLIFSAVAAIFVVLAAGQMLLHAISGDDDGDDDGDDEYTEDDYQDDLFEESDRLESNAEFQGGYYTHEQGEEAASRLHEMDAGRIVIDHELDD